MTDKLREAAQQALDDDLLVGQALHLIGALMSRGFLPNTLSSAEHTTLWDVVKRQLRCVNKEAARAALAQQDAQAVVQEPCAVVKWQTGGPVVHIIGDVQAGDILYRAAPTPPAQRVMLTASELLNMTPESIPAEHDGALLEYARAVIEAYERKNGIK